MAIKPGDKMPDGAFGIMTAEGPGQISSDALFKGKKVVVFAVPGAFTPTCSANHVPGFIEHASEFSAKGVDTVACLSVNDVFVMNAWGKDQSAGDKVMMLADGNGDYVKALGLDIDASGFGMGTRSNRFALVVDDGTVTEALIEPGPADLTVSTADSVLAKL